MSLDHVPSVEGSTKASTCPAPVRLYRESDDGGPVQRLTLPCRRRVCGYCGPTHWRPRVLAGLHSGLGGSEWEYLAVLLTAPADVTPDWNSGVSARWNHFVTILRRAYPGARLEFWRVAELQERGLVHFHFILRGLRFLPAARLRRLAVQAGFGSFVGVRRPRDYPGGVRSAGYYFGKYLLKAYSANVGVTKLVTCSYGWRVTWVKPERKTRGGWLFAGPLDAGYRLLGYVLPPSRPEARLVPRPSWWRRSWQFARLHEAESVGAVHLAGQSGRFRPLTVRWQPGLALAVAGGDHGQQGGRSDGEGEGAV